MPAILEVENLVKKYGDCWTRFGRQVSFANVAGDPQPISVNLVLIS